MILLCLAVQHSPFASFALGSSLTFTLFIVWLLVEQLKPTNQRKSLSWFWLGSFNLDIIDRWRFVVAINKRLTLKYKHFFPFCLFVQFDSIRFDLIWWPRWCLIKDDQQKQTNWPRKTTGELEDGCDDVVSTWSKKCCASLALGAASVHLPNRLAENSWRVSLIVFSCRFFVFLFKLLCSRLSSKFFKQKNIYQLVCCYFCSNNNNNN